MNRTHEVAGSSPARSTSPPLAPIGCTPYPTTRSLPGARLPRARVAGAGCSQTGPIPGRGAGSSPEVPN